MKNHFGCPVQATSNVLAGKWKVLIVWHLSFGSRRFAEIRDLLPGVSEKVLTAQLRELERDHIIRRLPTEIVSPRVDYMLSEAGTPNAACESFMKTLKYEEVLRNEYRDLAEALASIREFLAKVYNQKCLTRRSARKKAAALAAVSV